MRSLLLVLFMSFLKLTFGQNGGQINFDGPLPNSIVIPAQSLWEVGEPAKNTFDSSYSAPRAIVTDTVDPYPVNSNSYFDLIIRSPFPVGYFDPVQLQFRHRFNTDTLKDAATISYTYDGGLTWVPINQNTGFYSYTQGWQSAPGYSPITGFSGNSGGWYYTIIDFFQFCDGVQPVDSLILRFNFSSDSIYDNKDGWMIDDLIWNFGICPGVKNIQPDLFSIVIANEVLIITANDADDPGFRFKIYDSFGRLVDQSSPVSSSSTSIDLTGYSMGLYFLTITKPGGDIIVKRFMR